MLFPNFRLFIFSSVVLSFNHLHLSWVSAQSDDIDNTDDGQQVSCPVCSSAFSEQPQGLFGKPSLMQTLRGVRVQGFENTLGTRLGDFLFGPVPTATPVTRVVRQTGTRNRGRGRGRGRGRDRFRGGGRRRRPRRGRGGRRGRRGRLSGNRPRSDDIVEG